MTHHTPPRKEPTMNTTPALLGIAHDGPVVAESHSPRFTWTVQPEDFPALIERVNTYGGPDFWTITPA